MPVITPISQRKPKTHTQTHTHTHSLSFEYLLNSITEGELERKKEASVQDTQTPCLGAREVMPNRRVSQSVNDLTEWYQRPRNEKWFSQRC